MDYRPDKDSLDAKDSLIDNSKNLSSISLIILCNNENFAQSLQIFVLQKLKKNEVYAVKQWAKRISN